MPRLRNQFLRSVKASTTAGLPKGQASLTYQEGLLVLEGGSFRGLFTAGILDAWMEQDLNIRHVLGVSAGALNGMNYISGQIGRSVHINLRYRNDSRYLGTQALFNNHGLIGFDFILQGIQEWPFDSVRFFAPNRDFIAVATDVNTGQACFFKKGESDILAASQASASMPLVSSIVDVDGHHCLDGGCANALPFEYGLEHYEKVIVIRTQPKIFRKPPLSMEAVIKTTYRNYPNLVQALLESVERYNAQCDQLEKWEQEGRLKVIYPEKSLGVSRLEKDIDKLRQTYQLGYRTGQAKVQEIKEYLNA